MLRSPACSTILVGLLAVASFAGLLIDDLYRDPDAVRAMFRGYDLDRVDDHRSGARRGAPSGIPALGARSARLARAPRIFGLPLGDVCLRNNVQQHLPDSRRGVLCVRVRLRTRGGEPGCHSDRRALLLRTPVRLVGGILLFLAATLALFWSAPSLIFAFGGELPSEGSESIVPSSITHLGWVLDSSLLVPAYATPASFVASCRVGLCARHRRADRGGSPNGSSTGRRWSFRRTPTSSVPRRSTRLSRSSSRRTSSARWHSSATSAGPARPNPKRPFGCSSDG